GHPALQLDDVDAEALATPELPQGHAGKRLGQRHHGDDVLARELDVGRFRAVTGPRSVEAGQARLLVQHLLAVERHDVPRRELAGIRSRTWIVSITSSSIRPPRRTPRSTSGSV